jgi:hypothetical protein
MWPWKKGDTKHTGSSTVFIRKIESRTESRCAVLSTPLAVFLSISSQSVMLPVPSNYP